MLVENLGVVINLTEARKKYKNDEEGLKKALFIVLMKKLKEKGKL